MEIGKINGATRVLGAPANWDHSKTECVGLPVLDFVDENGRAMISAWMPTPDELARLNPAGPQTWGCVSPRAFLNFFRFSLKTMVRSLWLFIVPRS